MSSWMPDPNSGEDAAFEAYKTAALANEGGAFPEYEKLIRILRSLPMPALATAAQRQLVDCMKRDFHEHNRWSFHRTNAVPAPESDPEVVPEPEPDEPEEGEPEEDTREASDFGGF